MSGYGHGSWFAKLFCSALPLAKSYIAQAATDFASSTLYDWGSGKDLKKSASDNLRSTARTLGEQLKSRINGKGLKRSTVHHSSASTQGRSERHKSCQKKGKKRQAQ
jgi:hypothetical protein